MDNNSGKTLYVTDLDGTLMRNNETISGHTIETINSLIDAGMAFTYATARSIESARRFAGELRMNLPVITRNGAVLADNNTGRHIEKAVFTAEEIDLIRKMIPELPQCGFVSCFIGETMIRTYLDGEHTEGLQAYVDYYAEDPTMQMASDLDDLFRGLPGYVTLSGDREYIRPIYERAREYTGWECVFSKDTYRDDYWLEICPQNCTKAKTILKLKERYGFRRVVVFGDSVNDIPMFRIADEAYAVSNSIPELKELATAVIGTNEEDAVADCLWKMYEDENGGVIE